MKKKTYSVIIGITTDGKKFRPSDWAERTCGVLSAFRNHRISYSPLLKPAIIQGHKSIIIDSRLEQMHAEIYKSILYFAHSNNLVTKHNYLDIICTDN
tara:strand:+ start:7699 stop:7992 length:294 start_codon:yes stop_codon:yes gene_type:complete